MTALVGLGGGVAAADGFGGGFSAGFNGNLGSLFGDPDCRDFDNSRLNEALGRGLEVVGLTTDNRLICFEENRPGSARDLSTISGLTTDTSVLSIDYRPANGELYGLGNSGGIYTINVTTGAATKRSTLNVSGPGVTPVPLTGTRFGIDFNPVPDRLRIVSDTGQNLRVDVTSGDTTVDGTLTYTAPPAAPVAATGVVGAAYTNNDADPNTVTTLYDVDSNLDQVAIQAPPNNGILNPVGKLGVDTTSVAEADIYSTIRGGTTVDVDGYAVLTVGGRASFHELNLFTGKATSRGNFATRNAVAGVAIPLNQR